MHVPHAALPPANTTRSHWQPSDCTSHAYRLTSECESKRLIVRFKLSFGRPGGSASGQREAVVRSGSVFRGLTVLTRSPRPLGLHNEHFSICRQIGQRPPPLLGTRFWHTTRPLGGVAQSSPRGPARLPFSLLPAQPRSRNACSGSGEGSKRSDAASMLRRPTAASPHAPLQRRRCAVQRAPARLTSSGGLPCSPKTCKTAQGGREDLHRHTPPCRSIEVRSSPVTAEAVRGGSQMEAAGATSWRASTWYKSQGSCRGYVLVSPCLV